MPVFVGNSSTKWLDRGHLFCFCGCIVLVDLSGTAQTNIYNTVALAPFSISFYKCL